LHISKCGNEILSHSNHRLNVQVQQSCKSLVETTPGAKDDKSSGISSPVLQEVYFSSQCQAPGRVAIAAKTDC
jgi:hypothetical protein